MESPASLPDLASGSHLRDPHAFRAVVLAYQDMVFNTCRRVLGNEHDVEEMVQETFLVLAQRGGEVRSNLGAWLHACALNRCRNFLRADRSRRRAEAAAQADRLAGDASGSEPGPGVRELEQAVDAALAELSAADRHLVIEHFLRGRSQGALGAELGIDRTVVLRRIQSAVDRLRDVLRRRGVTAMASAALMTGLQAMERSRVPHALSQSLVKIGLAGLGAPLGASAGVLAIAAGLIAATVLGTGVFLLRNPSAAAARSRDAGAPGPVSTIVLTGSLVAQPGQDPVMLVDGIPAQISGTTWAATVPLRGGRQSVDLDMRIGGIHGRTVSRQSVVLSDDVR